MYQGTEYCTVGLQKMSELNVNKCVPLQVDKEPYWMHTRPDVTPSSTEIGPNTVH